MNYRFDNLIAVTDVRGSRSPRRCKKLAVFMRKGTRLKTAGWAALGSVRGRGSLLTCIAVTGRGPAGPHGRYGQVSQSPGPSRAGTTHAGSISPPEQLQGWPRTRGLRLPSWTACSRKGSFPRTLNRCLCKRHGPWTFRWQSPVSVISRILLLPCPDLKYTEAVYVTQHTHGNHRVTK